MMRATPVVLATVALISAGCGSNTPSGGAAVTRSATPTGRSETAGRSDAGASRKLTARDKAVKFSECVRAHGVGDFPDPTAKGEYEYGVSVTPAVFKKATDACKDLEPPGALSSKRSPKQQSASLKFADCMREQGVKDFPDPVDGEPVVNTYKIPSSNTPNGMTVLNAAMQACRNVGGLGG